MAEKSLFRCVLKSEDITARSRVPEMRRVPPDKPFHGPLLCEGIFEVPLHWSGSRRQRCYAATGFCAHCEKSPRCDTFLVAIWDKNERKAIWVELTDHAAQSLSGQLEEQQKPYYRTVVKIGRERKTSKAPITVEIDEYARTSDRLPSPMLPDDTIIRVFESIGSTRKRKKKLV